MKFSFLQRKFSSMGGDEDSKVPNLSLVDFAENDLPLVEKMLTIEGTMLGRS